MTKSDDVGRCLHGVSLSLRGSGWLDTRLDTPPSTHRRHPISRIARSGKRASFNRLKLSYVSRLHDFQQVEGDPWEDLAGQAEADEIIEADFSRPWVQSHNQLRRLAKIHTAKSNPRWRLTGVVTNRGGLPALFEDGVMLDLPRYGISGPFKIERAVAAGDGSTCTFDLTSIDPTAWNFDAPNEEGTAPPIPGVAAVVLPDPPVNLTVLVERRAVNASVTAVFLRLVAAEPDRTDLSLIGRYRRVGDTAWLNMAPEGSNRASLISSVLAEGETYEVQGAIATYSRAQQSAWVAAAGSPVTAVADPVAPGQPLNLVISATGGKVDLSWTNNGAANVHSARLRRNGTALAPIVSGSGQFVSTQDYPGSGTWSYTVANLNSSNIEGPQLASVPASVTVP